MQIKTKLRFHLILVRMANIKKTATNSGEHMGVNQALYTVDGNR
jgi:hypothetical protein